MNKRILIVAVATIVVVLTLVIVSQSGIFAEVHAWQRKTPAGGYGDVDDNGYVRYGDGANDAVMSFCFIRQQITADINKDGYVGQSDLDIVSQHWGETGPVYWIEADVWMDGVIDTFDMVAISCYWNMSVDSLPESSERIAVIQQIFPLLLSSPTELKSRIDVDGDGNRTFNDVILIIQYAKGDIDEFPVQQGDIAPVAILDKESYSGRSNEEITFDASVSYDPDGSIVSYKWDFAGFPGDTEWGDYPVVNRRWYVEWGNWVYGKVTVYVKDNNGSISQTSADIMVGGTHDMPIASFTYSPKNPLEGQNVHFDASGSYDPDGGQLTYEWDINGWKWWAKTLDYVFEDSGTYTVILKVTDDEFGTDTVSKTVDVIPAPQNHTLGITVGYPYGGVHVLPPDITIYSNRVFSYPEGTSVTLTAIPTSGYVFDHWSGDAVGSANPATVTMDSDKTVTAHFMKEQPDQYTLTLQSDPLEGGSVAVVSVASASQHDAGSIVTITAIPNNGYSFDKWTGYTGGSASTVTFTMPSYDVDMTANFNKDIARPSWGAIAGILGIIGLASIGAVIVFKKR